MSGIKENDCIMTIGDVLVSEVEIDLALRRLADEIEALCDETDGKLLLLGILKGSVVFMGDLIKRIERPLDVDFMRASLGDGDVLDIPLGLSREEISGRHILIVEDIFDSGKTLSRIVSHLESCGAVDVKICTLLDKPSRRAVEIDPDFVGFEIPDEFVVGYGIDYKGRFRALPYIGVLKPL